jgi:hypothetical protein
MAEVNRLGAANGITGFVAQTACSGKAALSPRKCLSGNNSVFETVEDGFGFVHLGDAASARADTTKLAFPRSLEEYHNGQIPGVFSRLTHRMQVDPFNPVGSLIFFAAIIHTFLAARFMQVAHRWKINSTLLRKRKARLRISVPYG